jgi:hypothetical protein
MVKLTCEPGSQGAVRNAVARGSPLTAHRLVSFIQLAKSMVAGIQAILLTTDWTFVI